jgi:hypothetical protein
MFKHFGNSYIIPTIKNNQQNPLILLIAISRVISIGLVILSLNPPKLDLDLKEIPVN